MNIDNIPIPKKYICFEIMADSLVITRTDEKMVGIKLEEWPGESEPEKDIALRDLIRLVANDIDQFILEYAKGWHERMTGKPSTSKMVYRKDIKRRGK